MLLILTLASASRFASAIDLSSAPSDSIVECEIILKGPLQQGVLAMMFGNISRVRYHDVFARFYNGALTPALEAFGFHNGQVPVSLEIYQNEAGEYYLRLMNALKVIQTMRLQVDPTMIWRRVTKSYLDANEGTLSLKIENIFAGTNNGHLFGTKLDSGRNGQRVIMFRPIHPGLMQIILGVDVPCAKIAQYIKPDIAPIFVLSARGPFCRVGVLYADFRMKTLKKLPPSP